MTENKTRYGIKKPTAFISALLAILMIVSCFGTTVFAADIPDNEPVKEETVTPDELGLFGFDYSDWAPKIKLDKDYTTATVNFDDTLKTPITKKGVLIPWYTWSLTITAKEGYIITGYKLDIPGWNNDIEIDGLEDGSVNVSYLGHIYGNSGTSTLTIYTEEEKTDNYIYWDYEKGAGSQGIASIKAGNYTIARNTGTDNSGVSATIEQAAGGITITAENGYYIKSYRIVCGNKYDCITVKFPTPCNKSEVTVSSPLLDHKIDKYPFFVLVTAEKIEEKLTLELTANDSEKTYDGIALKNSEYKITGGKLAENHYISNVTMTKESTITEPGTQPNVIDKITIRSNNGTPYNYFDDYDVTKKYTVSKIDGTLTVNKIDIEITAGDDNKNYDGDPLTCDKYELTDGNLLKGHKITSVTMTDDSTVTNPGTQKNVIDEVVIKTSDGKKDVTKYYNIKKVNGTLEITELVTITITANSNTKVYNGEALIDKGYTTNGSLASGDILTATTKGEITDVGSTDNIISSYKIMHGNEDVTKYYIVKTESGTLTVTHASVTVAADRKEKVYGNNDPAFTATVKGLIGTDTVKYTLTRVDGENVGKYTITPTGKEEQGNYKVSYTTSLLEITKRTLKVTGTSSKVFFNGSLQSITAFDTAELVKGDTLNGISYLASGMAVGKYAGSFYGSAKITRTLATTPVSYEDVTANYNIEFIPGILQIEEGFSYIPTLSIKKEWKDNNNEAGVRPSSVKVEVYYGSQYVKTVTLNKSNNWTAILAYNYTNTKYFTFKELDVVDGYKPTYKWNGTVATLINTYTAPATEPEAPSLNKADHYAYIMGYPDGTVQPEGNITRAEAATIFFRLMTDASRNKFLSSDNDFSDVNIGDWYNTAISTLANAGIIKGYADGTYDPNGLITRAEIATLAVRFESAANATGGVFTDIEGHWAQLNIQMAANNGWINGYGDGSFKPDQYVTRAETVALINRVLERAVNADGMSADMVTWSDNSSNAWYYADIQEATNSHTYVRVNVKVPAHEFYYEQWLEILPNFDWTIYE